MFAGRSSDGRLRARFAAARRASVVVDTVGTDTFGGHGHLLHDEPLAREIVGGRIGDLDVEKSQAQPAAEMLVGLGVGLVADGFRAAASGQDPDFGQLGEGGVDGPAPELGHHRGRASVNLVGGQMLGCSVGERVENRAPLGGDAQAAGAKEVARIVSEGHTACLATSHSGTRLDRMMSYLGAIT